jgi:hypothetical protein
VAPTTDRTHRRSTTLGPLARRLGFVAAGAVALVGVGAGTAHTANVPTADTGTGTVTRVISGVPVKVAAPAPAATSTAVTPVKPAAKAPAKPAAKPAVRKAPAKPAAPTRAQLMPHGTPGGQAWFKTNPHQVANAATIVKVGRQMHLPPRAWVDAIACSLQESKLTNLGNLGANNDHDSLGLFQQRPTSGWGTPRQILNTQYAAHKFYQALRHVDYRHLPLTVAVQKVQVSAFPQAYAKWEKMAADLVTATYNK